MLERRAFSLAFALGLAGASGAVAAAPTRALPVGYAIPEIDGRPVSIENAIDGRTVAAWAYRSGREFDLAISVLGPAGTWSDPTFLGLRDGMDQVQPALAVDLSGNTYLVMTVRPSMAIYLAVLPAAATTWTEPTMISLEGERASLPALRIVADRLVVAYRSRAGIVVRDLPLFQAVGASGVQDGPDILPPTANGEESSDSGSEVNPLSGDN
jgi:hypothetical protein